MVEVAVGGCGQLQRAEANVVEGLAAQLRGGFASYQTLYMFA